MKYAPTLTYTLLLVGSAFCVGQGQDSPFDLSQLRQALIPDLGPPQRELFDEDEADEADDDCGVFRSARENTPRLIIHSGGPQGSIKALAFSGDSERLYSGGLDKVVQVWGFQTSDRGIRRTAANAGVLVQNLRWEQERGPAGLIYALAAHPKERILAVGGYNARFQEAGEAGDIVLFDTAQNDFKSRLSGHSRSVASIDYSPTGDRLVSATSYGEIILWTKENDWKPTIAQPALALKEPLPSYPLLFLDEHHFAYSVPSATKPGYWNVVVRDARDLNANPVLAQNLEAPAILAFAKDAPRNRWAVSAIDMPEPGKPIAKGSIYSVDGIDKPIAKSLRKGRVAISMDFDPAGRLFVGTLMFTYADGTQQAALEMWDFDAAKMIDQIQTSDRDHCFVCKASPDGNRVVAFGGRFSELLVYLLKDRQGNLIEKPLQQPGLRLKGRGRPMLHVAFADSLPYRLGIGDVLAPKPLPNALSSPRRGFDLSRIAPIPIDDVAKMSWMKHDLGTWSARITNEPRVALLKNGQQHAVIDLEVGLVGSPRAYTFISAKQGNDPYAIAIGTTFGEIYVYGLRGEEEPPKLLRAFRDHGGMVTALSASPDGKYLASSSNDQTLKIWSLEAMNARETRFGPASIWGASFTFEEDRIVVSEVLEAGTTARKGIRDGDVVLKAKFDEPIMTRLGVDPKTEIEDPRLILKGLEISHPIHPILMTMRRGTVTLPRKVLIRPAWLPLVSLFLDDEGEWAAFTPQGYYDSSVDGDELFGWHLNRGPTRKPDFFRADQFRGQLERPEVIKQLLAVGNLPQALRLANDDPANADTALIDAARTTPRVTIISPKDAEVVENQNVPLIARVEYMAGGETPSSNVAYVNGVPGKPVAEKGDDDARTFEWSADVVDTYNRLRVVVQDQKRSAVAFEDVHFRLRNRGETRKPKLNLFLVAAGEYQNVDKLKFSIADAESITQTFRDKTGDLYELGLVKPLYDQNVTRESVDKAVEEFKQQLDDARPDDLVVVFLAGHGLAVEGKYYFVPVTSSFDDVAKQGVSWDSLRGLSSLRCKKLFLLDTCHSGNFISLADSGATQLKSAVRPLKQDDILIVTATEAYQNALESNTLGHGVFTNAILDGLAGAADSKGGDKQIQLQELVQFVEAEVPNKTRNMQTPRSYPAELFDVISLPLSTFR